MEVQVVATRLTELIYSNKKRPPCQGRSLGVPIVECAARKTQLIYSVS